MNSKCSVALVGVLSIASGPLLAGDLAAATKLAQTATAIAPSFPKAINIQGGDHHGTTARVRAGIQAAGQGVPAGYPDYVLHKMVTVMKGGQEVKISKRAGSYVTLRDLVDWTGRDAVRFFMLSRKADTEFVFDVDLALKRNDENPVFYVQYAHARICSVIAQWVEQGGDEATLAQADLARLTAPTEAALMLKLAEFPAVLAGAAADFAPHDIAFYLRDVAGAFHSYYANERFLVDDPALARARIAACAITASDHCDKSPSSCCSRTACQKRWRCPINAGISIFRWSASRTTFRCLPKTV